jgi:TnpA family transposase
MDFTTEHYREGQEDQLGALGLVVNMIVLWNTNLASIEFRVGKPAIGS